MINPVDMFEPPAAPDRARPICAMTHISIFQLNVERSRALIGTHSQLHNKQGKPKTVVSDIMRAAVVMVVSAIDAYLHGLSEHVERAAQLTPPPAALLPRKT